MKDKILQSLKTRYSNLGFSEKAFGGVAEFLSATVSEESQIETAVGGVESLLKSFQGDIDSRVNSAVAKTKAELEKKPPKPADDPKKPDDPNDITTIVANAVKAAVGPLQSRIEGYEKRETQKTLHGKIFTSVKDRLKSDSEKKGFEAWVKGRSIDVEDESKLDEVVESLTSGFTEFRQEMINQGVITDIPLNPQPADAGTSVAQKAAETRNTGAAADGFAGKKL